jgi:hypothetical protein
MEEVVLDQAGLDLLLAHPHIVDVTVMSIAATESRVDSPCSWQTLTLAWEVDIRTLAHVPLHSLQQPLRCDQLLLPPDVPPDQLPQLLLKATTRIVQHRHLFNTHSEAQAPFPGDCLSLCDEVGYLTSTGNVQWHGGVQPAFSRTAQSALFEALEPLASIGEIQQLSVCFGYDPSTAGPPPRVRLGKPDLKALNRTWGSRITRLCLDGVALAPGFFPALETRFPHLEYLELRRIQPDGQGLANQIMPFCQRMTRPMTLFVSYWTYV